MTTSHAALWQQMKTKDQRRVCSNGLSFPVCFSPKRQKLLLENEKQRKMVEQHKWSSVVFCKLPYICYKNTCMISTSTNIFMNHYWQVSSTGWKACLVDNLLHPVQHSVTGRQLVMFQCDLLPARLTLQPCGESYEAIKECYTRVLAGASGLHTTQSIRYKSEWHTLNDDVRYNFSFSWPLTREHLSQQLC